MGSCSIHTGLSFCIFAGFYRQEWQFMCRRAKKKTCFCVIWLFKLSDVWTRIKWIVLWGFTGPADSEGQAEPCSPKVSTLARRRLYLLTSSDIFQSGCAERIARLSIKALFDGGECEMPGGAVSLRFCLAVRAAKWIQTRTELGRAIWEADAGFCKVMRSVLIPR